MSYRLKPGQEAFAVVDGADAGARFERGKTYPAIPAGYEDRFEQVSGPGVIIGTTIIEPEIDTEETADEIL